MERLERNMKSKTVIKKQKILNQDIFIQIASYRDSELLPTIRDCIANAKFPENLRFVIAWQHAQEDLWDTMDEFQDDLRFTIIDIPHTDTKGVCWARSKIQKYYNGEAYTLQLDSHHRFTKHWDTTLIGMVQDLQAHGHKKPLLTAYIPSYNPLKDPEERAQEPWWMTFDRFTPGGAVFFIPSVIPDWQRRTLAYPGRFYSAHFAFTVGQFCLEVPHDPQYLFHGEEISIAVRAYTWGYDLFAPHKVVVWHEYTRSYRPRKVWDDQPSTWGSRDSESLARNRKLFGMDGEQMDNDMFGVYGFGVQRTLEEYERYAGIKFSVRGLQQHTLDHKPPPNPSIDEVEEYNSSFSSIFKHCIDIGYGQVPLDDYDFWVVAFENENGDTIHRNDADINEVKELKKDTAGYIRLWRQFNTPKKPYKWVVWPHSVSEGWCERIEGLL